MLFSITFGDKYYRKLSKMCMTIFSPSGKYRVNLDDDNCLQDKLICRGYLSAWQTLLYAQGLISELYFEDLASEIEKYNFC